VTACYFRGTRSPWPVVATGINHGDKYVEGFDIMGDRTRKRIRHLEVEIVHLDRQRINQLDIYK